MHIFDQIIVIGILLSVSFSVTLVFMGLDTGQGLIIALVGIVLTLLIDTITRLHTVERDILRIFSFAKNLRQDKWLLDTVEQIIDDYEKAIRIDLHPFPIRAKGALEDCRDDLHHLADGYMWVKPLGRYTFGQIGISYAKDNVLAVSYANRLQFWRGTWGEKYFRANKEIIDRGVKVTRIFIATKDQLLSRIDLMQRHAEARIQVYVAILEEVPIELQEDYLVQDEEVLVKVELNQEGMARDELISIQPTAVRNALARFEELRRMSRTLDEFVEEFGKTNE